MTYIVGYEYTYMLDRGDGLPPTTQAVLAYHHTWEEFIAFKRHEGKITAVGRRPLEYAHACDETRDVEELTRRNRAS